MSTLAEIDAKLIRLSKEIKSDKAALEKMHSEKLEKLQAEREEIERKSMTLIEALNAKGMSGGFEEVLEAYGVDPGKKI